MNAWDVAVVGAGPAGALAARRLAQQGAHVVLLDKAAFPRFKVCGCCLSARALATLDRYGLRASVNALGGEPLSRMLLASDGARAGFALPAGLAVSRARLDDALVGGAVGCGARLRERTRVVGAEPVPGGQRLSLRARGGGSETVTARAVLVADGLGGGSLRAFHGFRTRVTPDARIGLATVLPDGDANYAAGMIHMACTRWGYCGVVRVENGKLAVAAAVEREAVRRRGGPEAAVAHLLAEAGLPPLPEIANADWQGTPGLTRRAEPKARSGIYLTGDAAGYAEPFTGEGMSWALASGARFAELAGPLLAAGDVPEPRAWQRAQRALVCAPQRRCRRLSRVLRRPALVRLGIGSVRRWPALGAALARRIGSRGPLH